MASRWIHALTARLRALVLPGRAEHDLDDELSFHIAMQTRTNVEAGMSEDEANRRARIAFGGVEPLKEYSRDVRPLRWARDFMQDLRFGLRSLRRAPGFTAVAVATLALGIGANTALFSVVSGILLRPLAFPEPDRLVRVWAFVPSSNLRRPPALPDYRELRDRSRRFDELGAYAPGSYSATGTDRPELLPSVQMTASMWSVLKVTPLHGRLFTDAAQQWGNHRVVVLSHPLWQRRFGGDPRAIGQVVELDGQPFTVVAVMPPSFEFGGPGTQLWAPMAFPPGDVSDSRNSYFIEVLGRLTQGISIAQAHADLSIIAADLDQRFSRSGVGVALEDWQESMVGPIRPTLLLLLGAVGLVLLIACANVANLLMARATTRAHELTVRATLGAGRGRLVRQLLTEHLMLAALGAGVGLAIAFTLVRAIPALGPIQIPRLGEVVIDGRVAGFGVLLALVTGVAFGAWPARHAGRASVAGSLKQTARTVAGSGARARARRVLITAEIALSLVLLVGAALLIISLQRVLRVHPGFEPDRLLTARLNLPSAQYRDAERTRRFVHQVAADVASLPGIRAVGITTTLPLGDGEWGRMLTIDSRPAPTSFAQVPMIRFRLITPDYFSAMGAAVRRGRPFTAEDAVGAPLVTIVNETMARRFWPDGDPIGQQISFAPPESLLKMPLPDGTIRFPRHTIVGVIGDLRQGGLERDPDAEAFVPFAQSGNQSGARHFLAARTTGDPLAAAAAIESAVHRIDRNVPVANVRSMESRLSDSVAQRRVVMLLLGGFALLALVIAVVGVYGVMAYMVGQRRTELGVRAAMGATAAQLVGMVMAEGMWMTVAGVGIGLVLAGALSRLIAAQLFQVEAIDPSLYAAATMLVIVVAGLACSVPAFRAVRVDPAAVLRSE
jgi:putative ABC transport system permease protein